MTPVEPLPFGAGDVDKRLPLLRRAQLHQPAAIAFEVVFSIVVPQGEWRLLQIEEPVEDHGSSCQGGDDPAGESYTGVNPSTSRRESA